MTPVEIGHRLEAEAHYFDKYIYPSDPYTKYAYHAYKNFLKHHHRKSSDIMFHYTSDWINFNGKTGEWILLADKWLSHGYPDLALFCEQKCQCFLNRTLIDPKRKHYRRRGSMMIGHPCDQGQIQPRYYRPTKKEWKLVYKACDDDIKKRPLVNNSALKYRACDSHDD